MTIGKSRKGKNDELIDLDGDNDEGGSMPVMESEREWYKKIQAKYNQCQACGPSVCCKIAVDGTHTTLTHDQVGAWALALVRQIL
jgi:hypothetical protein